MLNVGSIIALLMTAGSPLEIVDAPEAVWRGQKAEAQCGLISASVEHKYTRSAKRPDLLKGHVSYGKQKRSLAPELDAIASKIEGVSALGIWCESDKLLAIRITGFNPAGQTEYKLFVNDLLEVTAYPEF